MIMLTLEQLPERLRALSEPELELLLAISVWSTIFERSPGEIAATLETIAQGMRELQTLCEQEQQPAAAADRLLRELAQSP